jgi:aminoglycoside phosphotransferase (APT) family kinase protein
MPVKIRATLLAADCAEHPAVTAWGEFSGRTIVPDRIDVLWTKEKSTTYRLFGAGPSGTSIIVQYSVAWKAATERIIYEQILPCLPVTAPRFYGLKPESAEHAWMFLEDIGDRRYEESDPVHRSLAGRWIGHLHTAASSLPAARSLPDTGPQRYLTYLQTSRRTIGVNLDDPVLLPDDVDLLRRLAADLEGLERDWADIERACADMPASLAHGDFRPKNACLREGRNGLELFPIDWETAGWGVPAADLTRIDLSAYLSVVHTWWRGARLEDVERVAAVGAIFRYLSSIFWLVPQLAMVYKPIPSLRVGHWSLTEAVSHLRAITRD